MRMSASQFMDKQIMDLTASGSSKSSGGKDELLIDLVNSRTHARQNDSSVLDVDYNDDRHSSTVHHADYSSNNSVYAVEEPEEIVPSYDFHPTILRDAGSSASRAWASADSKSAPILTKNYSSLDSVDPVTTRRELTGSTVDMSTMVTEVDRTMKKYADDLLHGLEVVSARLTQLETRIRNMENSLDDVKVTIGNSHGSTDGKMRQLENILREVQTGVLAIKDKQEIVEAQLQLAKMQGPKSDQSHFEDQTTVTGVTQQVVSASHPPQQQFHPSVPFSQSITPVSQVQQNIPPPGPLQNIPVSSSVPSQVPQNYVHPVTQHESFYPPPGGNQETLNQQHHLPIMQPSHLPHSVPHPPPPVSHQQYPPPPPSVYPPPPQQPLLAHSHVTPVSGHPAGDVPYPQSTNFPPNVMHPTSQLPSGPPPSDQYYGSYNTYEPPSSRPGPLFSPGYVGRPGQVDASSYGSSSNYGGPPATKLPHLPTARILPQALPTASSIDGSNVSGSASRIPIDDVVDRVTNMGFPRDQVRATVQKLTEDGQSVELNIVLDKLMNGGETPARRGWFDRT